LEKETQRDATLISAWQQGVLHGMLWSAFTGETVADVVTERIAEEQKSLGSMSDAVGDEADR